MNWIKCSDRLPEEKGEYLCYIKSFEDSQYYDGWYNYIEIVLFDKTIIDTIYEDNKIIHILSDEMDFEINSEGYTSSEVTHWMPLLKQPKD